MDGRSTAERGSALVGLLLSLLIVVGLAGAGFALLSGPTGSGAGTSATSTPPRSLDAAHEAVNGAELAQVQAAAEAYAAVTGAVPADVTALVGGRELKTAPHCAYVIDAGSGSVAYAPTQVDPTCRR